MVGRQTIPVDRKTGNIKPGDRMTDNIKTSGRKTGCRKTGGRKTGRRKQCWESGWIRIGMFSATRIHKSEVWIQIWLRTRILLFSHKGD
jgi:hypothetical protein